MVVGALGVLFSVMTALSCEFVKGRTLTGGRGFKAGVFLVIDDDDSGSCSQWDGSDGLDEFIRTCAVIAPIVAACALSITLFQMVCCNICCSDIITSFALTASAIMQGLTFLMYQTDACTGGSLTCTMGKGAKYSIVAASFYFFCAVLICVSPKSEPLMRRKKDNDDKDGKKENDLEKNNKNTPEQTLQPPDAEGDLSSPQAKVY